MSFPDTLVVTPTLGTRSTLARTVDSVRTIGGNRVKHIIIAPATACREVKKKYPHLSVIGEPEHCKGLYQALNFGLKLFAKDFKYLTYINDDDFWRPEFKSLFEAIDNNPYVDVVYGRVNFVDAGGNIIGEQTCSPRYKDFGILLNKNIILFTQQATLTRSNLFLKLGGFDESYKLVADTKFWLEAIHENAKMLYVNKLCAAYTIQKDQLSADKILQKQEQVRLISNNGRPGRLQELFNPLFFRLWNAKIYLKRIVRHGYLQISKIER